MPTPRVSAIRMTAARAIVAEAVPSILIDTNLLVYLVDYNDPTRQDRARRVLGALEAEQAGCLSVQSLAEFFSVATRRLAPPLTTSEALAHIALFNQVWPVFDLTPMIALEAARGVRDHRLPYYDAQIWAAARLNQIPVVFTEDLPSVSDLEGVRFVNPLVADFAIEAWM
jgi:predicted nucleic acid-binding protein